MYLQAVQHFGILSGGSLVSYAEYAKDVFAAVQQGLERQRNTNDTARIE